MSGRGKVKAQRISLSKRAGTIFPVGRIRRLMKGCTHKFRVGIGAPIYQAAVMEYLAAEILELAGNAARDNKRRRITPRHILLAIANDEELNKLLRNVTIAQGGVMPHIQPELLRRKEGNKFSLPSSVKAKALKAQNAGVQKAKAKPVPVKKAPPAKKAAPAKAESKQAPKKAPQTNAALKKKSDQPWTVLSEKTLFLGQKFLVVQGNVADIKCDAVVHPTNASFSTTGEVGKALIAAGGDDLKKAIAELHKSHGDLQTATALLGDAPNLKAKHVVHVHSPVWGTGNPEQDLENVVKSALTLADEKNVQTIAFPAIGSGAGFKKNVAAQLMVRSMSNYFVDVSPSSIKNIYIFVTDAESIGFYTLELAKVDSS